MKIADDLQFRLLDLDGLKTLVNWAAQEGWNPGPHDAEVFFATDPEGFYGFFDHDEMIAGGSIVSYQKAFGFMGFFIVKPEYRASGIGRKLWYLRRDTLLARLNPGAAIGMDGVVAMQSFYKKGCFEIAFRDERHEKTGTAFEINNHITPINDEDFEAVMVYDLQCFGFERPQFMKPWIKLPESYTFKFVENGEIKGFAVLRKATKGYKICPLFADDPTIATELYKACLNAVPGEPVYLDIPVINQAAVELTKAFNTTYVFECARMYYGKPPEIAVDKIFGITTFELG
jgi:GNAT superfamily N-acetyltransferase